MNKTDIRVFIVEDDVTLGPAIRELVKKMGFQAVLCNNPTEALNQFRIQGAQLIILDCLLPKLPGIELAQKFKTESPEQIPIILTSGVFKDKTFVKDALHKTGAMAFLAKPFNMDELKALISKALEKEVEDNSPMEALLTSSGTPLEKIQLINSLGQIEAFDIPWLCCLAMQGSATGVLTLKNEKSKSAIYFSKGTITQVDMQSPDSFFGALLIEGGYLTPDKLEKALATKSSKKLGERLVDLNLISPHVIDITNAEQTAIRLSRIITEAVYDVSFDTKEIQQSTSSIDTEGIASFLVDWVNSKLELPWLKQRYLKWQDNPVVRVAQSKSHFQRIWNLPPLKNAPMLITDFEQGLSLNQTLSKGTYREDIVYQVFHLLILIGYMHFKREIRMVDEKVQMARLQKIWADMKTQDYFAVLGVAKNAKAPDVKKTYYDLAKIFHPDKIPSNASAQLKDLAQKVFGQMTAAYETLSNEMKRAEYVKGIEMGRAEKILQAEGLFEEGRAALKAGIPKKAIEKFEEAVNLKAPTSELLIHLAWSKIMLGGQNDSALLEVERTLNKIPPEDRHNSIYYFVKGLFQNMTGEEAAAKKNIQHALALNPKFLDAERALRSIESKDKRNKEKTDIFRGDLGTVVGNLFRKK